MKKLILLLIVFLITGLTINTSGQTSPDYIFGDGWGSGWSWTTGTAGTASLGNTYKWQFLSTETQPHYFKFGETASPSDGQGFWMNNSGSGLEYTGNGAMWSAYYDANMEPNGAIFFANEVGNYYVVKTRKDPGNSNCNFAIFNNGTAAPVTISSVARTISGTNLNVDVTISGAKGANEKIWVRYTTDNWVSSHTYEANTDQGSNVWRAMLPLADGAFVSYYTYTTIQQATAPDEADADFYTINYNNNGGVNYTVQIGKFSGDYYIPKGANAKGFDKLSTAVTNINLNGMSANANFYITADFTETVNIGLINNSNYTLTIRPDLDADRTITFNKSTDNAGPSGAFCMGIGMGLAWTDLSPTKNVIIDGFSVGGSTRRLKIATAITHHGANGPILLMDYCSNIQIKNTIIHHTGALTGSSNYGIYLRVNTLYGTKKMPSNINIENNQITATQNTASQGIGIYAGTGSTGITLGTGIIIKDNIIIARTRGVFLYYVDGLEISGNEFNINQTADGLLSSAIMGNNGQIGNINIFNNKFNQLKSANKTSSTPTIAYGMRAIIASGGGTWYIYNNFFTGFDKTNTTAGETMMQGIRTGSTCYIRNNTFLMNPLTNKPTNIENPLDTQGDYCAINIAAGTPEIVNNIFISNEDGCYNHLIRGTNSGTSNYNLMYLKAGNTKARFNGTFTTFDAYKTGSGKDANSVSKDVTFEPSPDLHLKGISIGDFDLAGTPIAGITTDIDGQTRSTTYPYMGADENLNVPLTPYKRNINGDFTDWTGTPSGPVHATVVSNQEAIYKGEGGDARTDQHGAVDDNWKNNDIADFRFTRDNSFIYFGIKMNDITDINRPYIAITIDKDQIDDTPLWIGANSGVSLAPGSNRGWERQIALHAISNGVLGIQLFADDGGSWYNPISNYSIMGSADNDVIEAKIALYDLGLTPSSTLRLSVASFNNNLAPFAEEVYSYIDIVTPGYSGTGNAWVRGGENQTALNANVQWDQSITPLPVELAGFTALPSGQKIDLKWSTKTEVNSYKFVVERSLKTEDGSQNTLWEAVGEVNASGNSNSPKEYSFSDKNLADGKYSYRLKMIDNDGTFEYSPVVEVEVEVPNTFALSQNYPNPFNPVTQIQYQLPVNSQVKLMIFSITGELVTTLVDENQPAGNYTVPFDASALASGTYIYRLVAGDFVSTKKMVVLK